MVQQQLCTPNYLCGKGLSPSDVQKEGQNWLNLSRKWAAGKTIFFWLNCTVYACCSFHCLLPGSTLGRAQFWPRRGQPTAKSTPIFQPLSQTGFTQAELCKRIEGKSCSQARGSKEGRETQSGCFLFFFCLCVCVFFSFGKQICFFVVFLCVFLYILAGDFAFLLGHGFVFNKQFCIPSSCFRGTTSR